MKRKTLMLFLDELTVDENGLPGSGGAENIVMAGLVWPRPMIDIRTTARTIRLEDNTRVDFTQKPFHERTLFKEIVGGEFGITIEITERKKPSAVSQFLSMLATGALNTAFPLPPAGETFRRIVHGGFTQFGRRDSAPKETVLRIGFGHATLDPNGATAGKLDIPLIVPETILLPARSGDTRRKKPFLTEGQPNGKAVLSYSFDDD